MRLMALTFGDENTASTYFRVLQYRPLFKAAGIELDHAPAKSFTNFAALVPYDVVLLQKTILSCGAVSQLRQHARRLVYDVDDRIWIRPSRPYGWWTRRRLDRRLRFILSQVDAVTVANQVLAEDFRALGGQASIFPMALDGQAWQLPAAPRNGPPVIGWTGYPVSLPFLRRLWPVLEKVQKKHPEVRVQLHTPEDPQWGVVDYEFIKHVPDEEPAALKQFDIGLLPLDDTPSARGKSPCKTLQYFASGAAVVCSPVGATVDMAPDDTVCRHATTPAEWEAALEELITNTHIRQTLADAGRRTFEERFDMPIVFKQIRALWGLDQAKPTGDRGVRHGDAPVHGNLTNVLLQRSVRFGGGSRPTDSVSFIRILALTFGDDNCASTHFRLLQYRNLMKAAGMSLEHTPAKSFTAWDTLKDYDVVILQKTLLKRGKVRRLAENARRFIYDADDRTWLRPGNPYDWITRQRIAVRVRQIAQSADACLAANGIIADDLRGHGANTVIIPMALNGETWHPPAKRKAPLTIGWTGSPASLQYLEPIRPVMVAIQRDHPNVRWQIHCGQNPKWNDLKYEHVPFQPGNEPATVRGFDIGLLPLRDGEFARGKSPIKALQYFASGVALIHSPVGATVELTQDNTLGLAAAKDEDWRKYLHRVITEKQTREDLAASGRKNFLAQHDVTKVFNKLASQLRS